MKTANLYLIPDDESLIDEVLGHLSAESTPSDVQIMLPTTRLCTLVLASLAKNRGAYQSAGAFTLEQWVVEKAGGRNRPATILDPIQQELLLTEIIQVKNYKLLRTGHERELLLLWNDLLLNDRDVAGAFDALYESLEADVFRSETHLINLRQRFQEIQDALLTFQNQITAMDAETLLQERINDVRWLVKHWDELTRAGAHSFHSLYVSGFTSIAPYYRGLIERFAQDKRCRIFLSDPPFLLASQNPLGELIRWVKEAGAELCTLERTHSTKRKTDVVMVSRCKNRYQEVTTAFQSCRSAIAKGVPASRTAILLTSEADYTPFITSHVALEPMDVNVALPVTLASTTFGGWLQSFAGIFTETQNATALVRWLSHPWTDAFMQWSTAKLSKGDVESFISFVAERYYDLAVYQLAKVLKDESRIKILAMIKQKLEPFHKKQDLNAWCYVVANFYNELRSTLPLRAKSEQEMEALKAAQVTLNIFSDFSFSLTHLSQPMNAKQFLKIFLQKTLASEVRTTGEPLFGIQILSLAESRYFPFEHVVLLGANEGLFPKSVPQDLLVDDFFKKKLGLPGWQALEAREDLSFGLLCTQIPSLHLCYSEMHADIELVPSRYVEILMAQNQAQLLSLSSPPSMEMIAEYEKDSESHEDFGRLPGSLTEYFGSFSATSLEYLIHCPYQFLLHRLGLRSYALPIPIRDVRKEGEWLHEAFEIFARDHFPKLNGTEVEKNQQAQKIFEHLCLDLAPPGFEQTALYQHLKRFALPKFIRHLLSLYAIDDVAKAEMGLREYRLENVAFALTDNNHSFPIKLTGKIDSIDRLQDLQVITDYKRKTIPDRRHQLLGISPQLSFYALAMSTQSELVNLEDIAAGYWSIINGEWHLLACGEKAKAKAVKLGIATTRSAKLEEVCARVLHFWHWRKEQFAEKAERFAVDTSECGLCSYDSVCRKADPRFQTGFEASRQLIHRMKPALPFAKKDGDHA